MRKTSRTLAVLTGLGLSIACFSAAPAALTATASGGGSAQTDHVRGAPPVAPAVAVDRAKPRTVYVRGQQVPVDVAAGTYLMRGRLVGDWLYVPRTPPLHESDTLYVEAGTEVFNGCVDRNEDGRCGRRDYRGELHVAFIYWASFDLDGNLIRGQCVHPITGGTGAFTGARGRLRMVDRPIGDDVKTTYRGRIVLGAVPSEGAAAGVSAALGSSQDTTSTEPLRRAC